MIEKNKWEGREVREDELLNENVLKLLEELHGKIIKLEKHYKVCGKEVDAIIYCQKSRVKTVGLELKEFDLLKAVEQAVERRNFFNYFYIVINSDVKYLGYDFYNFYYDNQELLKKFFENNIGLIVVREEGAFLVCPSYHTKRKLEAFGD